MVASAAVAGAAILSLLFRRVFLAESEGGVGSGDSTGAAPPGAALAGLLAATAFLVPLVFTIASADVFVLPKLTALRVALLVGLALFGLGRRWLNSGSPTRAADR